MSLAVGLLGLSALWLWMAADRGRTQGQFFGLWRLRHLGFAALGIWLAAAAATLAVGRKALFGWMAGTLMAASALGILEAAGLLGLVDYPALVLGEGRTLGEEPVPRVDIRGVTHPDLDHERSESLPFRYRTDRRGFRNAADRAEADVYLLGDSILVAGLIPDEETIAGRLEAETGRPVMNIALIGISPQRERDLLLGAGLPLKDRLVLHFLFEGNDLLDSRQYRSSRGGAPSGPAGFVKASERTLTNCLLYRLQRLSDPAWKQALRARAGRIDGRDYRFAWLEESFRGLEDEFGPVTGAIDDVRQAVESAGGTYGLVFVPSKIRVLGPHCQWPPESSIRDYRQHLNPLRDRLTRWAEDRGIPVLDVTDALAEPVRRGRATWFRLDSHPNSAGHEAMTRAVQQWETFRRWRTRATGPTGGPPRPRDAGEADAGGLPHPGLSACLRAGIAVGTRIRRKRAAPRRSGAAVQAVAGARRRR